MWSLQSTTGEQPPPLAWHTFTKIDHHRAVVFAGFTGKSMNNDTFVLDMETWVRMCMWFHFICSLNTQHSMECMDILYNVGVVEE